MHALAPGVDEWFGDYCWWERPNALSHPQASTFVRDLDGAKRALRVLYDDETCRRLVAEGHGSMVIGLFVDDGWMPGTDEMLQLGADLATCPGWEADRRLVARLRSADGYDGARFEVGIWAGMVRCGLAVDVEPAANRAEARPDFVVRAGNVRVAIELKSLSDPLLELNLREVSRALGHTMMRISRTFRAEVTLHLSDEADSLLRARRETFREHHLARFEREIEGGLEKRKLNSIIELESVGTLVITYPPASAGDSFAYSTDVKSPTVVAPRQVVMRALGPAREAAAQLGAVEADVRIAVIWGSRAWLHAGWAVQAAAAVMAENANDWSARRLDWVVFLNCHSLGESGYCEVDVEPVAVPGARPPIPQSVLDGLMSWGLRYRGPNAFREGSRGTRSAGR